MYWLRVDPVVFCRGAWIIERDNFLCAGYASIRGYTSKIS